MPQPEFNFEAYAKEFFAGVEGGEALAADLIERAKTNPQIVHNAKRFGMRESDYSREMNAAKAVREEADRVRQDALTYRQQLTDWQRQKEQEYAAGGGPRAVAQNPTPASGGQFMTPEAIQALVDSAVNGAVTNLRGEIEKKIEERGDLLYGVMNDANDCAVDYAERFGGKRMDRKALETFAIEQNLPIGVAYKLWIQPEVDKAKEAEIEKRIKDAEQVGYTRAMSERDNPTFTGDASPHPLFRPVKAPEGEDPREAARRRFAEEDRATDGFSNPAGLAALKR